MHRKLPVLAIAVALTATAFTLSPLLTSEFAGYRPEQFPVVLEFWPVQPAVWAFGIWGVIFIWLIFGAIWGLLNAPHDRHWQEMRAPFLVSLGLGIFWIAAAYAAPILATIMIVSMAGFAIAAMLRAGNDTRTWQARPVTLYAGWLTVATGGGTGVVLGGYGVLAAHVAALAMLAPVLVAAIMFQPFRPAEGVYPLPVIWALAGVIAANAPSGNWSMIAMRGIVTLAVRVLQSRQSGRARHV